MLLVFIQTVARRLLLTPGSQHSCSLGGHSPLAFGCLIESARMASEGYHHGQGDVPSGAGFADRLLGRIARLPRPFRLAIGWAIYLTLVLGMFVVSLMPVGGQNDVQRSRLLRRN